MISPHRFARWNSFAVRAAAVLVGLSVTLLVPALAFAQSAVPNVLGLYRGFSQSDLDPRLHPTMVLTVDRQRGSAFFGTLLMGAPGGQLPFTFEGKVDDEGGFKGHGTGVAGDVKFMGIIQDLGNQGGALVLASYKFTFPDGAVDKGATHLLRSFPPDPTLPPDITGTWRGTSASDLTGQQVALELQITSQDGTSLNVVLRTLDLFEIVGVGTIGFGGNFVFIGVGDLGRVLVGGQFTPPPDDSLDARYFRAFATGAVDLGTFSVRRLER